METVHTPEAMLQIKQGDCDDMSILIAALLLSIGIKCQFVALDQGKGFVHVWTAAKIGAKWIHMDATEPYQIGQHVPLVQNRDKLLIWMI